MQNDAKWVKLLVKGWDFSSKMTNGKFSSIMNIGHFSSLMTMTSLNIPLHAFFSYGGVVGGNISKD